MTSSSDLPSFGTPALRLLLIDDEPEILRSVGALLRKMGHDVKTAGNGQEGLEAYDRDGADIILSERSHAWPRWTWRPARPTRTR